MEHFKPSEIRAIARAEMDKWGLEHWDFRLNNRKRSLGLCCYKSRTIFISTHRVRHDSREDVINTLRHEIAHALHYERRGSALFERKFVGRRWVRVIPPHGREWKAIAREVGMTTTPASRSKTNIGDNTHKWRLVVIRNGQVEVTDKGWHRTPSSDLTRRYVTGRKRETLGNLYFAPWAQLKRFEQGLLDKTRIQFFRKAGIVVNPFGG